MRDIPGVAWIIGFFVFGAFGIFVYAKLGPTTLPPPTPLWKYVEDFRDNIQYRRTSLQVGQVVEVNETPYQIHMERLGNHKIDSNEAAKYILQIKPLGSLPMDKPWLGLGIDLGLVDFKPNETMGDARWVSFHKQAEVK